MSDRPPVLREGPLTEVDAVAVNRFFKSIADKFGVMFQADKDLGDPMPLDMLNHRIVEIRYVNGSDGFPLGMEVTYATHTQQNTNEVQWRLRQEFDGDIPLPLSVKLFFPDDTLVAEWKPRWSGTDYDSWQLEEVQSQ